MSDATAFESALQQNPDDLATWCAYADYLAEHDDPRGAFMQVQLALEDEARPKVERDALKKQERKLLDAHQRAWLGEFAPFVLDQEREYLNAEVRFTRGWLSEVRSRHLTVNTVRALGRAPETRFLTRLLIDRAAYEYAGHEPGSNAGWYEPGPDVPGGIEESETPALYALAHSPRLSGLRVFRFGDGAAEPEEELGGGGGEYGGAVYDTVARMPKLEGLYLYTNGTDTGSFFQLSLPNLRILRVDHETDYPLEVLAANPSLGQLTHLLCHPHAQRPGDPHAYITLEHLRALCRSPHLTSLRHLRLLLTDFGDDGAEEVVESGILKRLKVLDLSHGCMRDAGTRRLAACPDLKNLSLLDLTMNALTPDGVAALAATGVPLKTGKQHGEHPDQLGDRGWLEYLSHGDIE